MTESSDAPDAAKAAEPTAAADASPAVPEVANEQEAAATPEYKRLPFGPNVASSLGYLRTSAEIEGARLRGSDFLSVVLLPASCALLVAVSWYFTSVEVRTALFLLPLMAFGYYIGVRVGIVRGLTTRQAFLVWHILMATFLLGCTFTLFMAFLKDAILNNI